MGEVCDWRYNVYGHRLYWGGCVLYMAKHRWFFKSQAVRTSTFNFQGWTRIYLCSHPCVPVQGPVLMWGLCTHYINGMGWILNACRAHGSLADCAYMQVRKVQCMAPGFWQESTERAKETLLVLYFRTASNVNKAKPENTHICFLSFVRSLAHWLHLLRPE